MNVPIAVVPNPITPPDIEALLARIKQTREKIAAAREVLTPLEAKLRQVTDAYKEAVGGLHRRSIYLDAEIKRLRAQIDQRMWEPEEPAGKLDDTELPSEPYDEMMRDPEAVYKDELLELAAWVLDYDKNEEEEEQFADIQRLCNSLATSFTDILIEIPWGKVWTARNRSEKLADQYKRLATWHEMLNKQLEGLQQSDERLRDDTRHGLLQRFEAGAASWQRFIEQTSKQYEEKLLELDAILAETQAEWEEMER